jgi:hypothetical protein
MAKKTPAEDQGKAMRRAVRESGMDAMALAAIAAADARRCLTQRQLPACCLSRTWYRRSIGYRNRA